MKYKYNDDDKLLTYEIVCNDDEETSPIKLIAFVDEPAILVKGITFAEEKEAFKFKFLKDEMRVIAPAMIPDLRIRRKDKKTDEYYYVFFSKETIKKLVTKFKATGQTRKFNLDHDSNKMVEAFLFNDWIIESTQYDKSKLYDFDLPIGTWMVDVKVENPEFWESEVKDLEKYGFSIEGEFQYKLLEFCDIDSLLREESINDIDSLEDDEVIELYEFAKEELKKKDDEDLILDYLSNCGISLDEFKTKYEILEKEKCTIDELTKDKFYTPRGSTFFWYQGIYDDKNRNFCRKLLDLNKAWSFNDIQLLSDKLGYSIFKYFGGFNCRHFWERLSAKEVTNLSEFNPDMISPTDSEIKSSARAQTIPMAKYV